VFRNFAAYQACDAILVRYPDLVGPSAKGWTRTGLCRAILTGLSSTP
jgi:hypothetical protein